MTEIPQIIRSFEPTPALLQYLLTSDSDEARHFQLKIRSCNSALAMASVRTDFVSRGLGRSKYSSTVTVYGRMYHEIQALQPATRMLPRFASLYIHDTEHATSSRDHFYG